MKVNSDTLIRKNRLTGYCFTILVITVLSLLYAQPSQAAELEEILREHIQAQGGKEKLDAVKSLRIESTMSLGGMNGTGVTYFKAPDKFRTDVTLPVFSTSQGCDGNDCWMSDPQGLTHSLGHELKGMMVTQLVLQRSDYATPASFDGQVKLVNEDATLANDTAAAAYFVIEISPSGGIPARLWIDHNTYLIRQVAMKTDMGVMISELFDYQLVEGILFPHSSRERTDAGIIAANSRVSSIELNVPLSDTLFQAPGHRDRSVSWGIAADSIVIPCELWHNHLYFKAMLAGEGPYNLIFDTGAGGLALDAALVRKLDLNVIGTTEARGVGGTEESSLYQIESLQVGEIVIDSVPVSAIDFGAIEASGTRKIDGIVGYTFLSRYIVAIDYGRHEIILYPQGTQSANWGERCDLTIDFRLPYIDATVNDSIVGAFRLDTGSVSTLDLNSPFVLAHGLVDSTSNDYIVLTSVGVGGTSSGLVGILDKLAVCGFEQDSVWTGFTLSEQGIFAGASTAGNIGAGLLKRFRLTFDYSGGSVYFQPVEDYDAICRVRNMAGIGFELDDGDLRVAHLLPDHLAYDRLQVGDVIRSINGLDPAELSLFEIERLLVGGHGLIKFDLERDGKLESVEFQLDGYF